MFKLKTLVLDIANFANNLVTFAKIQQIGAYKTLANITGSTANISEVNIGYTPNGAVTLSGNVTYAKSDFAGRTHLLLSATGSTRTFIVSNTGFTAGDFICLLIDQNSSASVSVVIGSMASPRTISTNRGNIINALFDGTNWHVWSGGGVFNTSNSSYNSLAFGLASRVFGSGYNATVFGTGAVMNDSSSGIAIGFNAVINSADGTVLIAPATTTTSSASTGVGSSLSLSGGNVTAMGNGASADAIQSSSFGKESRNNGFGYHNSFGAFILGRRFGATRFRYDITTSAGTNPSLNGEKIAFSGTTANDTITELFLRGVSSNRCVLQAKNDIKFRGQATAFRSDYSGSAGWDITGIIKRDGSNNTTLVGVTATLTHSDGTGGTLVLTIDADDTNESLRVRVTGNASETWTWGVELELLDLRIA